MKIDFDLIIFDCDGVLIDSELLVNRAEVEFLKSFGIEYELSDYMYQFVGKSNKDILKSLESSHNVCLPKNFWELAEQKIFAVFQEALKPTKGIFEFIASINIAKCVASSSSLHRLDMTLRATGLFEHFSPYIFSSEQVNRGKPAPDLFLFAAEQMKVKPEQCLVIEDSPHVVRAAVDANMTVVGFTGGSHIQLGHEVKLLNEGAEKVFSEMSQYYSRFEFRDPFGNRMEFIQKVI